LSAAIRTRVGTRSAGIEGAADSGGEDPIGGSEMRGLGVGTAAMAVGTGVAGSGSSVGSGSAVTGFVYESSPPARSATPSAVRQAGTIRVRIRSRTAFIGAAW